MLKEVIFLSDSVLGDNRSDNCLCCVAVAKLGGEHGCLSNQSRRSIQNFFLVGICQYGGTVLQKFYPFGLGA